MNEWMNEWIEKCLVNDQLINVGFNFDAIYISTCPMSCASISIFREGNLPKNKRLAKLY